MRFLKKLLIALYLFLGGFTILTLTTFLLTGSEPSALIAAVFSVAGVECILGMLIKKQEGKHGNSDGKS